MRGETGQLAASARKRKKQPGRWPQGYRALAIAVVKQGLDDQDGAFLLGEDGEDLEYWCAAADISIHMVRREARKRMGVR